MGFRSFGTPGGISLLTLGGTFFAVAPDQHGYNLSSKPADVDQYQVRILVDDVRALSKHLGYSSWSGMIGAA
jgi:epoxide hydrolase 4